MLSKLTSFLGFLCIESSGGLTRECVEKVPLKVFSCVHRLDLTVVHNNLSSSCRWWDQGNAMCVSQNIWPCHDPNNWLKICKCWIIVSNRIRSTLLVEWYWSRVEKIFAIVLFICVETLWTIGDRKRLKLDILGRICCGEEGLRNLDFSENKEILKWDEKVGSKGSRSKKLIKNWLKHLNCGAGNLLILEMLDNEHCAPSVGGIL